MIGKNSPLASPIEHDETDQVPSALLSDGFLSGKRIAVLARDRMLALAWGVACTRQGAAPLLSWCDDGDSGDGIDGALLSACDDDILPMMDGIARVEARRGLALPCVIVVERARDGTGKGFSLDRPWIPYPVNEDYVLAALSGLFGRTVAC